MFSIYDSKLDLFSLELGIYLTYTCVTSPETKVKNKLTKIEYYVYSQLFLLELYIYSIKWDDPFI